MTTQLNAAVRLAKSEVKAIKTDDKHRAIFKGSRDPATVMKKYGIEEFINQFFNEDVIVEGLITSGFTMQSPDNPMGTLFMYAADECPSKIEFTAFTKKVDAKLKPIGYKVVSFKKIKATPTKVTYELVVKEV